MIFKNIGTKRKEHCQRHAKEIWAVDKWVSCDLSKSKCLELTNNLAAKVSKPYQRYCVNDLG